MRVWSMYVMKVPRSVLLLVSLATFHIALRGDGDSFVATSDPALPQVASVAPYALIDTNAPVVSSVNPPAGQVLRQMTQVEVLFDRPVGGVDAGDLLVNGLPATCVSGVAAGPYVFEFPAQPAGLVGLKWVSNHEIVDAITEEHPRRRQGPPVHLVRGVRCRLGRRVVADAAL